MEQKLSPQYQDPVQGNNLVAKHLGKKAVRRHCHFKEFFCIHNPMEFEQTRKVNPLQKVTSFLKWVKGVSQAGWKLGKDTAGDEQTIGFQGHHADKRWITYKSEGDGFQCDAICDKGYTYNFCFCNMPPPKKYIDEGWSRLHARMFSLFGWTICIYLLSFVMVALRMKRKCY